jgi:hypothetical protein
MAERCLFFQFYERFILPVGLLIVQFQSWETKFLLMATLVGYWLFGGLLTSSVIISIHTNRGFQHTSCVSVLHTTTVAPRVASNISSPAERLNFEYWSLYPGISYFYYCCSECLLLFCILPPCAAGRSGSNGWAMVLYLLIMVYFN